MPFRGKRVKKLTSMKLYKEKAKENHETNCSLLVKCYQLPTLNKTQISTQIRIPVLPFLSFFGLQELPCGFSIRPFVYEHPNGTLSMNLIDPCQVV